MDYKKISEQLISEKEDPQETDQDHSCGLTLILFSNQTKKTHSNPPLLNYSWPSDCSKMVLFIFFLRLMATVPISLLSGLNSSQP